MNTNFLIRCLATGALLIVTAGEAAQSGQPQSGDQPCEGHRGPPQVAIDACASLSAGTQCSFIGRNSETVSGQCAQHEQTMACEPANRPQRQQGGNGGGGRPQPLGDDSYGPPPGN